MISAILLASAPLAQVFNCSASPDMMFTLAPTGEFVNTVNNAAQAFNFELSDSDSLLKIVVADDHRVFAKGEHDFFKYADGPSLAYSSVKGPCVGKERPCGTLVNLAKNANGSMTFIAVTMRSMSINYPAPTPKLIRPGMAVIHGDCTPMEQQK